MAKQTRRTRISERSLEAKLERLLNRAMNARGGFATTFEEGGVLTCNRGLTLDMGNGQEFQLTIVESTRR